MGNWCEICARLHKCVGNCCDAVAFNTKTGQPLDTKNQDPKDRIPPQTHY